MDTGLWNDFSIESRIAELRVNCALLRMVSEALRCR